MIEPPKRSPRTTIAASTASKTALLQSLLTLLVLIHLPHCGHTAKMRSMEPQQLMLQKSSQLMDNLMQATQPNQCHALQPQNMDTADKLVLAPIVFQGKNSFTISCSNKGKRGFPFCNASVCKRFLKCILSLLNAFYQAIKYTDSILTRTRD